MTIDCRSRQCRPARASARLLAIVLLAGAVCLPTPVAAQEHAPAPTAQSQVQPQHAPPAGEHGAEAAAEHESIWATLSRLANFAILVGILVYFLKSPIAAYLVSRSSEIRRDLVAAADLKATATAQLAEIQRKMQALPAELEALRTQGAEDVRLEQERIAAAAAAERERLIEQTRREIAMRLRLARRELTEHAAALAVRIAEERIRRTITPEDQLRLVDRYTTQLGEAR